MITDKTGTELRVGDLCKYDSYEFPLVIRHIGVLCNCGKKNSIWSEFNNDYNGKVLPQSEDSSCLCYTTNTNNLLIIKRDMGDYRYRNDLRSRVTC